MEVSVLRRVKMQKNSQNPPGINKPRPAYKGVRRIMLSVSREVTDFTDAAKSVTKNVSQVKYIPICG